MGWIRKIARRFRKNRSDHEFFRMRLGALETTVSRLELGLPPIKTSDIIADVVTMADPPVFPPGLADRTKDSEQRMGILDIIDYKEKVATLKAQVCRWAEEAMYWRGIAGFSIYPYPPKPEEKLKMANGFEIVAEPYSNGSKEEFDFTQSQPYGLGDIFTLRGRVFVVKDVRPPEGGQQ